VKIVRPILPGGATLADFPDRWQVGLLSRENLRAPAENCASWPILSALVEAPLFSVVGDFFSPHRGNDWKILVLTLSGSGGIAVGMRRAEAPSSDEFSRYFETKKENDRMEEIMTP